MAIYKVKGERFVRKYTANQRTPTYAAGADAIRVAESLCDVEWSAVGKSVVATFPAHSGNSETDKDNVANRDWFDAALFCGEHANSMHRAFANGACYRFTLPDSAVGVSLAELKARIYSDPYNANGARIAICTSSSPDLPMACATCRNGSSDDASTVAQTNNGTESTPATEWYSTNTHVEGVAPRRSDGSSWFANSGTAFVRPAGGLELQKHLFVFVLLERYDVARNGYLEGSSYADPTFEISLSSAVQDLVEGETNDCSYVAAPVEFEIVGDGVLPDVTGDVSGALSIVLTAAGTKLTGGESGFSEGFAGIADEVSPVNSIQGVRGAYARIGLGDFEACPIGEALVSRKRNGVGFCVKQFDGIEVESAAGAKASPRVVSVASSAMIVPFSIPCSMKPNAVRMDWSSWLDSNTPTEGTVFNLWINRGNYVTDYDLDVLKNRAIYDATSRVVGNWELVGTVPASEGSALLPVDGLESSIGSFMVTAYVPQENIDTGVSEFVAGTGDFHYNGLSASRNFGVDESAYPVFEPETRYGKFDGVCANQPTSRGEVIDAPDGANVTAILERNGLYILGTDQGFYWSNDFEHWNGSNVVAAATKIIWTGAAYAAVSPSGIYCSADGKVWTQAVAGNARDIVVFDDKVVAVVVDRAPYHSPLDCSNWAQASSVCAKYWNCLGVIGSMVVAGTGDAGSFTRCEGVFYSSDADTWAAATFTPGETLAVKSFSSVIRRSGCDDMIIAVAYHAATQGGTGVYFTSTDGVTWTKKTGSAQSGTNAIYDSGLLIFGGETIYVSSNFGTSFAEIERVNGSVAKIGGLYCVCSSDDGVFMSKDAVNWVKSAADASVVGDTVSFISFGGNGKIFKYPNDLDMKMLPCFAIDDIEPVVVRQQEIWKYPFFNQVEWDLISSFPTGRFSGRNTLCVPDLTLIG